jgi:hypothetical protein
VKNRLSDKGINVQIKSATLEKAAIVGAACLWNKDEVLREESVSGGLQDSQAS